MIGRHCFYFMFMVDWRNILMKAKLYDVFICNNNYSTRRILWMQHFNEKLFLLPSKAKFNQILHIVLFYSRVSQLLRSIFNICHLSRTFKKIKQRFVNN